MSPVDDDSWEGFKERMNRKPTLRMKCWPVVGRIKNLYWMVYHFFERVWWGYDSVDIFEFGPNLIRYAYPILLKFREVNCAFVQGMTFEQWSMYIDQMVLAFELFILEDEYFLPPYDENGEADEWATNIDYGMKLFGKYLLCLWY